MKKNFVDEIKQDLKKAGLPQRIMIDCSHGNSSKLHTNQPKVLQNIGEQIAAGETAIFGVMIESNLEEGSQKVPTREQIGGKDPILKHLKYGVSITDACVSWDQTIPMLKNLAEAVRKRRSLLKEAS
jgi:3-deoxy-7-phosphoheptulonate synthase